MTNTHTWSISQDAGPALCYLSTNGTAFTKVDEQAPDNTRERAVCRALLHHAIALLDQADDEERCGMTPTAFVQPAGSSQ